MDIAGSSPTVGEASSSSRGAMAVAAPGADGEQGSPLCDVSNIRGAQRQVPPSAVLYRYVKQQHGSRAPAPAAVLVTQGGQQDGAAAGGQGWNSLVSFLAGVAIDG